MTSADGRDLVSHAARSTTARIEPLVVSPSADLAIVAFALAGCPLVREAAMRAAPSRCD